MEAAIQEPWLWKALAVGTSLDLEVVRKVKASGGRPLEQYWVKDLGLPCSNGYKVEADQKQWPAVELKKLKNLAASASFRFQVHPDDLPPFRRDTLHRTRFAKKNKDKLRVYRGPMTLIKEALGRDRSEGWAWLSFDDLVYNQSFYGYSGAGHENGELLVRYLQLFAHSQLWLHHALLTSAKLGFERPNIYKEDLDECLFFPLERLTDQQRGQLLSLSKRLLRADNSVFADIDTFFGELYGLDELDVEVIRDTLETREPNDELGVRASTPPTVPERTKFMRRVESILRPFFKILGEQPELKIWPSDASPAGPFVSMVLRPKDKRAAMPSEALFREAVLPLASETGASRIIKQLNGALLIAVLRQYRYWTPSRARMLAATILREHLSVFEG